MINLKKCPCFITEAIVLFSLTKPITIVIAVIKKPNIVNKIETIKVATSWPIF